MDKVKVGIPRSVFYYYYKDLWKYFFEKLNIDTILSPKTNKEIINEGLNYANDEMCLSLKIYMGHINYLKDKCDYVLIPRIDDYGINDQMCTNFLSLYDISYNLFNINILNYNVCHTKGYYENKEFIKMGKKLGYSKKESRNAYLYAKAKTIKNNKKRFHENLNKLNSNKIKILIIGHPYNVLDEYVGKPIINLLNKLNIEVIYAFEIDSNITNKLSYKFSKDIYWKYSKDLIGAIKLLQNKINGIIFLSSFPCGPDSLVNELVIRKINTPYLNLVLDDLDSTAGIETRIESFIDIIEQVKTKN